MKRLGMFLAFAVWAGLMGCSTTKPQRPNPAVAPPLPTPAPLAPGAVPPAPGGQGAPAIPLPPGAAAAPVVPASPDQTRVQAVSTRLYQANPWIKVRPQWLVRPGDTPGVANQGEHYVLVSDALVHAASDGQLAAVMALQLADLASARQYTIREIERAQRREAPRPDFYQQRDGMSSAQANLEMAEAAKYRTDPRDLRRQEEQEPPIDPASYARQVLVQAGFAPQELEAAAPLLQRFPPVRPAPGR